MNFEITQILSKFELNDRERNNLARLFEFTNYLYDEEKNLTKTLNLLKKAKDELIERIQEMFEARLFENEVIMEDLEDNE
ncbi:MAG: hypothetical protein EU540_05860 [Promethearchaeota archaeon]|nr:MAG: hypothetical protein EU540_05860 [Candidatus Lokiarchaeota archaeon]